MGLFNTIVLKCPNCNASIKTQSKGGTCNLKTDTIRTAEISDLIYIDGDTEKCHACNKLYKIKITFPQRPICELIDLDTEND